MGNLDYDLVVQALTLLALDPADGVQIVGASKVASQHYPQLEPLLPLLVTRCDSARTILALKESLLSAYPASHPVVVINAEPEFEMKSHELRLQDLDHIDGWHERVLLYVQPVAAGGSFTALLEVVAHLRAPEGCPWDREQTLFTLRADLLDEAAEVAEAIDVEMEGNDNTWHIIEELGDLLLLPAMMIQIATEDGRFQIADVMRGIVQKLVRRHPHVFDNLNTDNIDEIVVNWETIKAQEIAARGEPPRHPLDGIPAGLPALEKASKLQSKAQKAGLADRTTFANRVEENSRRYCTAPNTNSLGELLWSIVAHANEHGLKAEDVLRSYVVSYRNLLRESTVSR